MAKPQQKRIDRVRTFGVDHMARYGLTDRNHQGYKHTDSLSPLQLYNALRGAAIGARLAHAHQAERDVLISLVQVQRIGVELLGRARPRHLVETLELRGDVEPQMLKK